ncbi:MAG: TonB-dependent receptor, partial [Chitinophagaceae bacterium]
IVSSFAGFKDVYSNAFNLKDRDNISIPAIKILEKVVNLADVAVTVKKPMFEQKIDRMVINVANSITNTGSTALEVLMRSPGITVNQQSNTLSINGKEGVVLLLNGKINRLPTDAIFQMLAGMSAANIERIELITTPPANFDAEGNAGFINIVLKKNTQYGTNGSLAATAGYGIGGGPAFGSNINVNNRKEKFNLYGDYSFTRIAPSAHGDFYRKVTNGSNSIENFMDTERDDFRRNHMGRIGLDYDPDKKTVLGVLLSGLSNMYGMDAVNNSNIFLHGILDTTIIIDNDERHPLDNYSVNLNAQRQLTGNQQLTFNVDYIFYRDANKLTYLNNFYGPSKNLLYLDKTKSRKETLIKFRVATVDYTKQISDKSNLDAGIKATLSSFSNDVGMEKESQNNWVVDKDLTSKHNLEESIFAAYTSLNVKLSDKINSKIGLRYEYTNSNLGSETKKNIVDRHYGNLFPSFFLSHALTDNSSFNFSYSRRITRPTFNDMAPFVYFVDPNTVISGNSALQPSIANAIKWDYLLRRFVFSLSYTFEKNTITNFTPRIDPLTNKQTFAAENQKHKHVVALTLALPSTITEWWSMQNNISGFWQQLSASYKGFPLIVSQLNFNINSTQSIVLPKNFSMEISGSYQSGGLVGIYKLRSITSLNFGLQKKFGINDALLFNITDFSGSPHYRWSIDAPEYNLITSLDLRFNVPTLKLTYTRKFGNFKIKANRSRTTGSEDERKRVQTN